MVHAQNSASFSYLIPGTDQKPVKNQIKTNEILYFVEDSAGFIQRFCLSSLTVVYNACWNCITETQERATRKIWSWFFCVLCVFVYFASFIFYVRFVFTLYTFMMLQYRFVLVIHSKFKILNRVNQKLENRYKYDGHKSSCAALFIDIVTLL